MAAIGRALGHPVTIFMPDWMSTERVNLIRGFGAEIHEVSKEQGGFEGSIRLAEELAEVWLHEPAGVAAVEALEAQLATAAAHRTDPPVAVEVVDTADADAFVEAMYAEHGPGLVHMVRLFVDDRNAAEDLVQEAFIRLHRAAHRIKDPAKAAPYLRSIVINLARDHNRRGLMSLRHQEAIPAGDRQLVWDGRDDAGRGMAAGVYLARLVTSAGVERVKLALVR